jgi:hypothetical protein
MTLRYANGFTTEAVLLSRTDLTMRIALPDSEDVEELNLVNGTWIAGDCEPVHVSFAWERLTAEVPADENCVCPPELAARLLRMLFHEDGQQSDTSPMMMTVAQDYVANRVI